VRLFLDTSVLLAATGSGSGASREVFRRASSNGWMLLVTPYVLGEVERNLPLLGQRAIAQWNSLRSPLKLVPDILTIELAVVFPNAKDRPILFSAFASSDVLLTLDRRDFADLLGNQFYSLPILRPGEFLQRERAEGRLV
jgi:predicted nucleic acid-binding protein